MDYQPLMPKRNIYRFYFGASGVGVACGIAWTLALIDSSWITPHHARILLWGIVAVIFTLQAVYLSAENRRIREQEEELQKRKDEFEKRYGIKL